MALALRESARRMIGVAVFSGVINILMLSGSLYMLQVYDRVIPSRNIATLFGLSLIVLFAYLVQGYFDAMRARMLCRIATLFDGGLQGSIHGALAALPLRGVKPVLMQQPLRDLDQVRGFMSGMGPTAFLDMPWIPLFLIALFLFHPAIGFTALLGTAAIIAMTLLTERISRGAAKAAMDMSAQRQVLADATQRNAEVIRALGMTDRLTARWSQANERYLQENIRATDVYANLGSGAKVLRYILQSGMLGIGAYLVVADRASGGIMIASSIMMGRALAPVEIALGSWKQLVAARQGLKRLRDICKATAPPAAPPVLLPRPSRELSVQDLTVTAPGSTTPIVSNISFSLKAGAGLALLGASASGKTSLSKALVGIWPAQHGVVRLDGAALDQWRNEDLGRHIGYLPQDVALFDGTVAENICRFDSAGELRRHPEGRADRGRARHHPAAAGGLCDPHRRGRHVAVGRAAAAHRAGAGGVRRSVSAGARRAQCQSRCRRRECPDPRHSDPAPEQVHRHRHLASSERACRARHDDGALRRQGDRVRPERGSVRARPQRQRPGCRGEAGGAAVGKSKSAADAGRKCSVMKIVDPCTRDEAMAPRRTGGPDDGTVGPQGAALILELQRLRRAFELENLDEDHARPPQSGRPPRGDQRPPPRPRAAKPKRPPKRQDGAGAGCAGLDGVGFRGESDDLMTNDPVRQRISWPTHLMASDLMAMPRRADARPGACASRLPRSPRRARGPIIAPDDPSLLNVPAAGPAASATHDPRHAGSCRGAPIGARGHHRCHGEQRLARRGRSRRAAMA